MSPANPGCVRFVARSIERHSGDAATLGQQLLLSLEVGRDRVRRTRPLMIEIPAARLCPTRPRSWQATPGLRIPDADRPALKGCPSLSLPIQAPVRWI